MLKSKMLKNKIIILCIYIFSNKICLASTNSISAWNAFTQILNNYVSSYSSSPSSSPSFFTQYNNFISASGQTYTATNYYVSGGSNNKVCIGSATTTTPNCVTFPYTKVKSATGSTLTNQVTINDCINGAQGSDFIYAPNLTLNCGTTGSKCSSPSISLGSAGTCYIDYGNYRGIYIKAYPAFAIKQKDPWDTNSNANTHATATGLADIVSFFPAISKAMQINNGFNPTCTYGTSSNNNMSCASPRPATEIFNNISVTGFLKGKIPAYTAYCDPAPNDCTFPTDEINYPLQAASYVFSSEVTNGTTALKTNSIYDLSSTLYTVEPVCIPVGISTAAPAAYKAFSKSFSNIISGTSLQDFINKAVNQIFSIGELRPFQVGTMMYLANQTKPVCPVCPGAGPGSVAPSTCLGNPTRVDCSNFINSLFKNYCNSYAGAEANIFPDINNTTSGTRNNSYSAVFFKLISKGIIPFPYNQDLSGQLSFNGYLISKYLNKLATGVYKTNCNGTNSGVSDFQAKLNDFKSFFENQFKQQSSTAGSLPESVDPQTLNTYLVGSRLLEFCNEIISYCPSVLNEILWQDSINFNLLYAGSPDLTTTTSNTGSVTNFTIGTNYTTNLNQPMDLAYLLKLILDITNFINIAYQASNMGVSPKEKATAIAASINLLNKVIGKTGN